MTIRYATLASPTLRSAYEQAMANLDQLTEDLVAGAVMVVTDVDLRIRRLPIQPGR
jgi:hypothetical protein